MFVYLDNHATTRTDPAVVQAMLPWFETRYANPGSITHEFGRQAADQVHQAIEQIGLHIHAAADEVIMTSGATESNNLALFGVALHPRQSRRKIVSAATEHRAILDPLARLEKLGFEIVRLPVSANDRQDAGRVDLDQLFSAIDHRTAMVTIMLANNEIGTIAPIQLIARHCRALDVVLHTDATQGVGRMPIDVQSLDVDLMSFSAHKFYGPKGIGGLYVRQSPTPVRLQSQIFGGGQQSNLRSGTLNSVGIIGMAKALELCGHSMDTEATRAHELRQLLWKLLREEIDGVGLNGPDWRYESSLQSIRLASNLNVSFPRVEGQSIMLALPELAVSSGSACTSAEPHPSHVLMGIGLTEDQARSSLRFGIGRFNTEDEIRAVAAWIGQVHRKLVSFAA